MNRSGVRGPAHAPQRRLLPLPACAPPAMAGAPPAFSLLLLLLLTPLAAEEGEWGAGGS